MNKKENKNYKENFNVKKDIIHNKEKILNIKNNKKVFFKRRFCSTLNFLSNSGNNKLINVEVRKKYSYTNDSKLEKKEKDSFKSKKEAKDLDGNKSLYNFFESINESDKDINSNSLKLSSNEKNFKSVISKKSKNEDFFIDSKDSKNGLNSSFGSEIKRKSKIINHNKLSSKNGIKNYSSVSEEVPNKLNLIFSKRKFSLAKEKIKKIKVKPKKVLKLRKRNEILLDEIDSNENKGKNFFQDSNKNIKLNKKFEFSILRRSFIKPINPVIRKIVLEKEITINKLARKMAIKVEHLTQIMQKNRFVLNEKKIIDWKVAKVIAESIGHKVIISNNENLEENILDSKKYRSQIDKNKNLLTSRAPIVSVMGHVDHGKTSIIDCIRLTNIASLEAGGITQGISIYSIEFNKNKAVFLDTPGHSAFSLMRLRGIKLTDIIILVVAADDGVKPQTIEIINYAKDFSIPIVVAINKIDKFGVEIERVKSQLSEYGIVPEDWGGDNQFVYVSAKENRGINELLEAIFLQAEILELKTRYFGFINGVVIESFLDKFCGPVATILIMEGVLNTGDVVLCGSEYGKVKAIKDEYGKKISFAKPITPVNVLGFSNILSPGDKIISLNNEQEAREIALKRKERLLKFKWKEKNNLKIDNFFANPNFNKQKILNLILKTNTKGSCEVILDILNNINKNDVFLKVVFYGIGDITENDINLAISFNAFIIGFNVSIDVRTKKTSNLENVNIKFFTVIYNLVDELKNILGSFKNFKKIEVIGKAKVLNIFKSSKYDLIAGCVVKKGILKKNNFVKVLRNGKVIHQFKLESLKRFKEDVDEVKNNIEFGIGIRNFSELKIGDEIEVFRDFNSKTEKN